MSVIPGTFAEIHKGVQSYIDSARRSNEEELIGVYERVSRIEKGKHSYSMDIQPDRAEEYAKSKGWIIYEVYSDPSRSGKNSRREGLQKLIRDIKAGKISVLVIHRLDRLYRNLGSLLEFIQLLKKYKVRLVSVTENIELNSVWGTLVLYILGAIAEMYIRQCSANTRDAKIERIESGLPNASYIFGYCRGLCSDCKDPNGKGYCPLFGGPDRIESLRGKIFVPHPIERFVVRIAVVLYSKRYSDVEISDHLNGHVFQLPDGTQVEFRTKGHPGKSVPGIFSKDNIREIVTNPFYVGQVAHYPTRPLDMSDVVENPRLKANIVPFAGNKRKPELTAQGIHEAIYPMELWQKNQLIRKSKSHSPTRSDAPHAEYAATGIVDCAVCYRRLKKKVGLRGSTGGHGEQRYRCATMLESSKKRGKAPWNESQDVAGVIKKGAKVDWDQLIAAHSSTTIRGDRIDKSLDELVSKLTLPQEWNEMIMAFYGGDEKMIEYERQSKNLTQELERYRDFYREGQITKADYIEQVMVIEEELNDLKLSIQPDAEEILPMLQDFSALWSKMTVTEKRGLLEIMTALSLAECDGKISTFVANSPFDKLLGMSEEEKE
jgi:DNA invertase Pin-like site-specific DNA recombinase